MTSTKCLFGFGLALALALSGACHVTGPSGRPIGMTVHGPSDDATLEIVESPPLETTLDHPDIANAAEVWVAMIDAAKTNLDFAEFYASEAEPKDLATSKLTPVIAAIQRAVARGVKVRFLVDSAFAPKYPETLETLRKAGATVRTLDFGVRGGGILHAKYFVADGIDSFVGSQNFDWRALGHIQEMGFRVHSRVIAGDLLDLFETDWGFAGGAENTARVHTHVSTIAFHDVHARTGEHVTLGVSPKGWLPDEASWELPKIVTMLEEAKQTIDVQVLTYKTKERDGTPFITLDEALRRAAGRGVHVRLMVSDWSSKPNSEARAALEALAKTPNVEVRVITIPRFSGGDIPFARVAHAKYMIVDGTAKPGLGAPKHRAWVGTSNWEGDYFTKSRDVSVIVEDGAAPARLAGIFEDGWTSAYAAPLTAAASAPPSSSGPARP